MHSLELVVATKNKKKLEEIREILKDLDVRLISLVEYENLPRVIENGKTFKENAAKKASKLARFTGKLTMGEDSGLCVEALGEKPGVYSSRFAGKNKSDNRNNLKVLRLLEGEPERRRRAYYASAVALADKNGLIGIVEGKCYGRIGFEQRGAFGFGYDPLFVIPRYKKTFAELGPEIKHSMSHRFRALKKARVILQKYIERRSKS
ncbi:MAG: RdgB/HAM1 family non-canonical purine NTP pyrophosphatase [Candidatus Omnitrophota bacterium]|jgi:XTP/dITP diphosphohydrolase